MYNILPTAIKNRLLAALTPANLTSLLPNLTHVNLTAGQELYKPGGLIDHIYFPISGMISLIRNLEGGERAEVGMIGREGMLGVSLLSGHQTSFPEAIVQIAGSALRMRAALCHKEIEKSEFFRSLLLKYSEALQAQIMQTAACNGHHPLAQRLTRLLLMVQDSGDGRDLPLTQEFLAIMLGVHRPSLTKAAGILRRARMISYRGGMITVLNRVELETISCECYNSVRDRFNLLLA